MKIYTFESEQWLPRPLDEVFAFFADTGNLQVLTPPWLHFKILTPGPVEMKPGALIDYRLRLHGVQIRWQSEITAWDPPHRFVDEQRRGPYLLWIHEHSFAGQDGGTVIRDRIEYVVPGGAPVQKLFVGPDLRRIFDYRRRKLREIFAGVPPLPPGN